jgi:hypothetical protein
MKLSKGTIFICLTFLASCQSSKYFDIDSDFPPANAGQETRAIIYNADTRGSITSNEIKTLRRAGNMYINQLIDKIKTADEEDFLGTPKYIDYYKDTVMKDAKETDANLCELLEDYESRDSEIDDAYRSMTSRYKSKLSDKFTEYLFSGNYSKASKTVKKSLELDGGDELRKSFLNGISNQSLNIKDIDTIQTFFEIASQLSIKMDDEISEALINNLSQQMRSFDSTDRETSLNFLNSLTSIINSTNFPRAHLEEFKKFEEKTLEAHTAKFFIVQPYNRSDYSIKGFKDELESKMIKEITTSKPYYAKVIRSRDYDPLTIFNDDYYETMSDALKGIQNKKEGLVLFSEIRSIRISNESPTTRSQRAKPYSDGSAFKDGLRSGVSYGGSVQHFEWTEETKISNASILAAIVLYDLSKEKVVHRDSLEAQKSYKQVRTFDLMAVGQDRNGYGNPVGPMKKVSAGWRPSNVDAAFKGSRSDDIPSSSEIRNDLFLEISDRILESVKAEIAP